MYPLVIKDVIPEELFWDTHQEIHSGFEYTNSPKEGGPTFWTSTVVGSPLYYRVWSTLQFKIKRALPFKAKLTLSRIHTNGQTFGQLSQFHRDNDSLDSFSCVIFTEPNWNTCWGGGFILHNPVKNEYSQREYVPNTGVIFPSTWEHMGTPPLHQFAPVRTTLAFTFFVRK